MFLTKYVGSYFSTILSGFIKLNQQNFLNRILHLQGFWNSVLWQRRRAGLYPLVPDTEEERAAFKQKYRETGKIPTEL